MKDDLGSYETVLSDDGIPRPKPRSNRTSQGLKLLAVIAALVLAGCLGAFVESTKTIQSIWTSKPKITSCGRTASEARARGCVLEPMVYGFMPPQCQFPEVTRENDPFSKWQWYADENMTQPLSQEQLWNAESIDLWTNVPGYHLEHCLFLYRKLMYGMEKKVPWLDKKTLGSHHAYHCVGQLSTSTEAWNATTWTGLGMYTCEQTPWS